MKKLFLLITMPLLALLFTACDKDDGENTEYNKFTINGHSYELNAGDMRYRGSENENTAQVDLLVYMAEEDEIGVYFEMHIPKSNNKLVTGTYSLKSDYSAFSFSFGYGAYGLEDDDTEDVNGGTIKVDVSGNIYTIVFDCSLENGGTIKGTYRGVLNWEDNSPK